MKRGTLFIDSRIFPLLSKVCKGKPIALMNTSMSATQIRQSDSEMMSKLVFDGSLFTISFSKSISPRLAKTSLVLPCNINNQNLHLINFLRPKSLTSTDMHAQYSKSHRASCNETP